MKKPGCWVWTAGTLLGAIIIVMAVVYLVMDREQAVLDPQTRAGLPGSFILLSEGVTHYQLSGPAGGPLVVLVNGFSVGLYGWQRTVPGLTAAGFRVLTYDLYGRGTSDRPSGAYTLERFTGQLDELLNALQIREPVNLVGLSMGGYIAAGYAARHPQRVRRLALLGPQSAPMAADPRMGMVTLPGLGEYIFTVYMIPVYLAESKDDFANPAEAAGLRDAYLADARYAGFRAALLATLRSLTGDPTLEYQALGRQGLPVLLIWGEEDQTAPIANAVRLQAAMPQARLRSIPGQRHAVYYEQPGLVNPLLVEFFK